MNKTDPIIKALEAQEEVLTHGNKLKEDRNLRMEYGDKQLPGAYLAYVRIQFMNTAGGEQFRISTIDHLGREGSGIYSPDLKAIAREAAKMIAHYHRETLPRKHFLKAESTPLEWFLFDVTTSEIRCFPNGSQQIPGIGDVVTVTLEEPK